LARPSSFWRAEITKMINVSGAPVEDAEIVDSLAAT